jgi:hypothetical protein
MPPSKDFEPARRRAFEIAAVAGLAVATHVPQRRAMQNWYNRGRRGPGEALNSSIYTSSVEPRANVSLSGDFPRRILDARESEKM